MTSPSNHQQDSMDTTGTSSPVTTSTSSKIRIKTAVSKKEQTRTLPAGEMCNLSKRVLLPDGAQHHSSIRAEKREEFRIR
jgi:hypothetical protein